MWARRGSRLCETVCLQARGSVLRWVAAWRFPRGQPKCLKTSGPVPRAGRRARKSRPRSGPCSPVGPTPTATTFGPRHVCSYPERAASTNIPCVVRSTSEPDHWYLRLPNNIQRGCDTSDPPGPDALAPPAGPSPLTGHPRAGTSSNADEGQDSRPRPSRVAGAPLAGRACLFDRDAVAPRRDLPSVELATGKISARPKV